MVRIILENKRANWFKQFRSLKKEFELSLRESIKLFYLLKRDKLILIQPIDDLNCTNRKLDTFYHNYKDLFDIELKEIVSIFDKLVDFNHYYNFLQSRNRNYRIWISRK